MPEPVGWGFIGAGGVARRRMLPSIADCDQVRLRAVMVRDQARAEAIAAEFGAERAYHRVEALLDDPAVEAVYIATPLARHAEQVLAAARAGKAILLEKPMAMSLAECDAMLAAVAVAGVPLAVCLPMRLTGPVALLKRWLEAGDLGEPTYLRAQMAKWYPLAAGDWRADPAQAGGGALMDLGSHLLDLVAHLLGPASALTAALANRAFDLPVEDTALVQLRLASGALASCEMSFAVADSENSIELYGTRGAATARSPRDGAAVRRVVDGLVEEFVPEPVDVYRAELLDFSAALRENRPALTSGADGRRNLDWLLTAYRAAASDCWLEPAEQGGW